MNSLTQLSCRGVMNHWLSALFSCFVFVLPAPKQKENLLGKMLHEDQMVVMSSLWQILPTK